MVQYSGNSNAMQEEEDNGALFNTVEKEIPLSWIGKIYLNFLFHVIEFMWIVRIYIFFYEGLIIPVKKKNKGLKMKNVRWIPKITIK